MQLEPRILTQIVDVIALYPAVTEAVLFGSRAMDTAKITSDIDIALKGAISALEAEAIARNLEDDLPTLLQFDVIAYERIHLPALKEHIDRVGIEIYRAKDGAQSSTPNTARA